MYLYKTNYKSLVFQLEFAAELREENECKLVCAAHARVSLVLEYGRV